MLQECSLISEVHEQIRKSFNISEPGHQSSSKTKKGSFEYLITDLKQHLINQFEQNKRIDSMSASKLEPCITGDQSS